MSTPKPQPRAASRIPQNHHDLAWRSHELMNPGDTGLLIVDVQEKLLPRILGHERLVWNVRRLMDAAQTLAMPISLSEQYPKGLGPTMTPLAERFKGRRHEKLEFSAWGAASVRDEIIGSGRPRWLVAGIETHVCIAQTALDLLAAGYRVYVAADAVSARGELDHRVALERLAASGATITTTEAALFEWCQTAAAEKFSEISSLVKEVLPQ